MPDDVDAYLATFRRHVRVARLVLFAVALVVVGICIWTDTLVRWAVVALFLLLAAMSVALPKGGSR